MSRSETRIVLVEDSIALRDGLRRMLSEIPNLIVSGEFAAADDAIKGISRIHPDVVILDIGLSRGSGLAVLRYLNAAHPGCKSFVFSNRVDDEYRRRATHFGASHVFDKTTDSERLFDTVAALALAHSISEKPALAENIRTQKSLPVFLPNSVFGASPCS